MNRWEQLRRGLAALDAERVTSPGGERAGEDRLAAALVILSEVTPAAANPRSPTQPVDPAAMQIVYTRRCDHLSDHPGQIGFPGGRIDVGETAAEAALREAAEEIALDGETVELLGRLPTVFIPPSRFWLQPLVARWREPHALRPAEDEVSEILRVRHDTLVDESAWRVVRHPERGSMWAWQLDDRHVLWGATAAVTVGLLDRLEPGWRRGLDAANLDAAFEVVVPELLDGP